MSRVHTCGQEAKHVVQDNCPMNQSDCHFQISKVLKNFVQHLLDPPTSYLTGSLAETKSDMSI